MKPNILWIMTDQQSARMLGCAGNPYVHTPNLDRLAAHSVRFTNTYCTNPVCLPSRFSLFTGLYPSAVGIRSNDFPHQMPHPTLPDEILSQGFGKLMTEAGYHAVYGGKEHLPAMRASDLGFEYICGDERDTLAHVCADFIGNEPADRPFFMVTSFINPHDICFMAISDNATTAEEISLRDFGCQENITMRAAQKWPKGVTKEQFFQEICPPLPENYQPAPDEPEAVNYLLDERPFKRGARTNYTDEDWRMHRWTYARLTELVDRQIGLVLDALEEKGILDNTVIIFTSDHGDNDASHKMEHKTILYNESCRVPLLIKGLENHPAGVTNDSLVCNGLDLICTVLDYAGANRPEHLRGLSLKDISDGRKAELGREALLLESQVGNGVVSKTQKYVHYLVEGRSEQFYDFATNPYETHNQLNDPVYAADIARMRRQLNELMEEKYTCHW